MTGSAVAAGPVAVGLGLIGLSPRPDWLGALGGC